MSELRKKTVWRRLAALLVFVCALPLYLLGVVIFVAQQLTERLSEVFEDLILDHLGEMIQYVADPDKEARERLEKEARREKMLAELRADAE